MIFHDAILLLRYLPTHVVGYNTITLPAGVQYNLIGISFDAVGTEEGYTIDELFGGKSAEIFTSASAYSNADQIQIWNGKSYNTLYLNQNTLTTGINPDKNGHWCLTGTRPDASWAAQNGGVCIKKFPAGTAFWIKRKIPAGKAESDLPAITLTVSGQVVVKADGKAGYDINGAPDKDNPGYTLLAAGFTAPFSLNPDVTTGDDSKKVDWLGMGCFGASAYSNADQIQIWNGKSYNTLYLNQNTLTTGINPDKNGHWCLTGTRPDASWAAQNGGVCIKSFEPTVGFWYKRVKGQTSGFKFYVDQPYSL